VQIYKDELLHIHQFLIYLMKFLLDNGVSNKFFEDYESLDISPHHIHKTKLEHKHAILLLACNITQVLAENNEIVPLSFAKKFDELANRCSSK
jgi:hypothetical protein